MNLFDVSEFISLVKTVQGPGSDSVVDASRQGLQSLYCEKSIAATRAMVDRVREKRISPILSKSDSSLVGNEELKQESLC